MEAEFDEQELMFPPEEEEHLEDLESSGSDEEVPLAESVANAEAGVDIVQGEECAARSLQRRTAATGRRRSFARAAVCASHAVCQTLQWLMCTTCVHAHIRYSGPSSKSASIQSSTLRASLDELHDADPDAGALCSERPRIGFPVAASLPARTSAIQMVRTASAAVLTSI